MTDKEAMKLALFALDIVKIHFTQSRYVNEAIVALKERLAQEKALQALHNENERLGLYKDAYAEQEQQPVAWPCHIIEADFSERTITLGMECGDYKVSAGPHWLSTHHSAHG